MVPEGGEPRSAPHTQDLGEHDREVLEFLSRDPASRRPFQGLRRRLGIHPEQLSRALHRLADDNLVERTDLGYRVTPRALSVFSPGGLGSEEHGVTILQTYLPADLDLRALVQAVHGSWIGPLRWYGLSESADGVRLAWALEDDSIRLETLIRPGHLVLMAKVLSPDRLDDAARLGHQLFQHIVREVSGTSYAGLSG